MRQWTIPTSWQGDETAFARLPVKSRNPHHEHQEAALLRPARRLPLRKSGGFIQMENIFDDLGD